jgi:hypothetical protein
LGAISRGGANIRIGTRAAPLRFETLTIVGAVSGGVARKGPLKVFCHITFSSSLERPFHRGVCESFGYSNIGKIQSVARAVHTCKIAASVRKEIYYLGVTPQTQTATFRWKKVGVNIKRQKSKPIGVMIVVKHPVDDGFTKVVSRSVVVIEIVVRQIAGVSSVCLTRNFYECVFVSIVIVAELNVERRAGRSPCKFKKVK